MTRSVPMRRIRRLICLTALLTGMGAALPVSAQTLHENYVVLSNGERVGHLRSVQDGREVTLEYHVDNNGRGPQHRVSLTLDDAGFPAEWRIQGRSTFGGDVDEHFTRQDNLLRWTSQSESGEHRADVPMLYVANDDNPWSQGLYARLLMDAPEHTLPVLPGGELRLREVRELTLQSAAGPVTVNAYRLTGLSLDQGYVLLDSDQRLFAQMEGRTVFVREGYEDLEVPLRQTMQTLEAERLRELSQRLTHRFDTPVRIRNVRVFDPVTGEVGALSSVVFFRGRITAITTPDAEASDREAVIDGEGGVLVPGLHDMHSHTSMTSGLFYLAAGVTSTRDMGNNNAFLMDLMPRLESGELAGPRVYHTGFLEGRSPYSARNGFVVDSESAALDAVRWYADHGYWQIKIYNSFNPEWIPAVTAEAHRLGMRVSGHIPAFYTADQAAVEGYDDIAHINQLMLMSWLLEPTEDTRTPLRLTGMARGAGLDLNSERVQSTIALLRENGLAIDTTAVTLEQLMMSRQGQVGPTNAAYVEHMPIGYQRFRRRSFVNINTPEEDRRYREGFETLKGVLKLLHDNGIQMLPGTDYGTGFSVHREHEIYVEAGLTPAESLRLGTLAPEQYMNRDQNLGTIERGKFADFFLIPRDPTADISAIREIRLVVRNGEVFLPSEIYTELGIRPFAPPVHIQPAPEAQPGEIEESGDGFLFDAHAHEGHVH